MDPIRGVVCHGVDSRRGEVNGQPLSCSGKTARQPRNGGHCFKVDAGKPEDAWFTVW
jgi:hypothetical protein